MNYAYQKTMFRLASVAGVNLNVATKTTLYTVPTGKSCVILGYLIRAASISLTTASFGGGFNADANDVITPAVHAELTGSTLYSWLAAKAGAKIGVAADVLGLKCNHAQGAVASVTISVFGYLF